MGMSSEREHGGGVYLAGAWAALPFALATFVLGISFGVLARSLGWGVVAPIVFSVIAFSGSAQFAVVAVMGAGGGHSPELPVLTDGGRGSPFLEGWSLTASTGGTGGG
jgi:predicted branched-subunit amino acid permease